jgi:hypothetical protein
MVQGETLSFGKEPSSSTQEEENAKAFSEARRESTLKGMKPAEPRLS